METLWRPKGSAKPSLTRALTAPLEPKRSLAAEVAAALLVVALSTACAEILYRLFGLTRLSPVFLSGVLLVGAWLGSRAAILAAFGAFSVYNFYLVEPRFTFSLVSAEDYLNLAVFLGVALMTGGLAGRLRDERYKAQFRADVLARLYDVSRRLSVSDQEEGIWEELRGAIAGFSTGDVWAIIRGTDGGLAPPADVEAGDSLGCLVDQSDRNPAVAHRLGEWCARGVEVEGATAAVFIWRETPGAGEAISQETLIDLLCDLAGATVARVRLAARRAQSAALLNTERLRTALLSSISHDLRTPLSAILASASSLADYGEAFDAETRRDLALNIQGEAEALNQFVGKLLSMTRLESGAMEVQPRAFRVVEVAYDVADRIEKRTGARRVSIAELGENLEAEADPDLFAQALLNVVENAIRFSPPDSPVELSIERRLGRVELEVSDHGPGLADPELSRIFDKFYRVGGAGARASGSGLGLSITKGLLEAMGGTVCAVPRRDDAAGLSIIMSLPEARR